MQFVSSFSVCFLLSTADIVLTFLRKAILELSMAVSASARVLGPSSWEHLVSQCDTKLHEIEASLTPVNSRLRPNTNLLALRTFPHHLRSDMSAAKRISHHHDRGWNDQTWHPDRSNLATPSRTIKKRSPPSRQSPAHVAAGERTAMLQRRGLATEPLLGGMSSANCSYTKLASNDDDYLELRPPLAAGQFLHCSHSNLSAVPSIPAGLVAMYVCYDVFLCCSETTD